MHLRKTVFFCFVMIWSNIVALADREERSEEMFEDQEIKPDNSTSVEAGPPDSHEAMNNREINPKNREKRSYEFLMGLINNNSRYEVTRVDPSVITEKPKVTTENIAASELLLELMVRIAAHPDQWDKVHKLLHNIERDLSSSRNIVKKIKNTQSPLNSKPKEQDNKNKISVNTMKSTDSTNNNVHLQRTDDNTSSFSEKGNNTKKLDKLFQRELKWPRFDNEEPSSSVKFVNNNVTISNKSKNTGLQSYPWQTLNKTSKSTYPKNFAYHRVTGKPIHLKSPKAYIAVSVIAPKPLNSKEDDITLENELHQLKPWTHIQNLKNMASIRSRWLIQTDDNNTRSL